MNARQPPVRIPILALLITLSLAVGWYMPAFYDWTGSDQSRPWPLIGRTAIALLLGTFLCCLALPWFPVAEQEHDSSKDTRVRFKLRSLLIATGAAAIAIAGLAKFPMLVSGLIYVMALGFTLRPCLLHGEYRRQTLALLACMFLPFTWILFDGFDKLLPALLWMVTALPMLIPANILGHSVGQNPHDLAWLPILFTSGELVAGALLTRLGTRPMIAYLLVVLLASTFGSFIVNAMLRA